jgi:hypothetical protein
VITIKITDARIATKTVPDLRVSSPSTLLSAAEQELTEVSLGLFRESTSLRQQEEAIKIEKKKKRLKSVEKKGHWRLATQPTQSMVDY